MELVVRKADLLRELQLLQGIVERKNTIPILANVLMDVADDAVRLLATDLEVGLRTRCPVISAKPGAMTLPAKKLYEIVKALPETDVRIQEDKAGVRISADRFESRMSTLPKEDFPALPDAPADMLTLSGPQFRQMVTRTQFAITGEDTRYFLNGAQLLLKGDVMTLVATDGHRLALVSVKNGHDHASLGDGKVILPRKTLIELSRLLADGAETFGFQRLENHLFFDVAGRVLISRVIDGQFPAYERVIPKGNDKKIDFDRDRLANAVRRVALLSNERSRAVRFQVAPGQVEIASSSPEFGEAKESLQVDYEGPPLQICFNAQYVVDFLSVVETDLVALEFKDEMSQAVFKPLGDENGDYIYVIMPMRI